MAAWNPRQRPGSWPQPPRRSRLRWLIGVLGTLAPACGGGTRTAHLAEISKPRLIIEPRLPVQDLTPAPEADRALVLASEDGCYTIERDVVADVDGAPLVNASRGDYVEGPLFAGHGGRCDSPTFVVPFAPERDRAFNLVTMKDRTGTLSMEVAHLFARRTVRVLSPQPARPGSRVRLEWEPATDDLSSAARGLFLDGAGGGRSSLEGAALVLQGHAIEFDVPALAPGRYTLGFDPHAKAEVRNCKAGECIAVFPGAATTTLDVGP